MILYIAGPMTGLPDLNYPKFCRVQARLEDAGYRVLNPALIDEQFPNDGADKRDWVWYMRHSVRMIAEVDGIATLSTWQNSRGACVEVELAKGLELPVKHWGDWLVDTVYANHRKSWEKL